MSQQLECRIIIRRRQDGKIDLAMHDPANNRTEKLGTYGPDHKEIDKAVDGLKRAILGAGHLLTFSDRSE